MGTAPTGITLTVKVGQRDGPTVKVGQRDDKISMRCKTI